jgi:N-sulfoglucosamine sulfohydrolase
MMYHRLIATVALLILAPTLALAQEKKAKPNVLIILSDDHSARFVGCYGNKDVRTPNIDKLASKGIRLDRFYVTTPQCVPSRASLMTGRAPIDLQMTRFSAPLPREHRVYPEILRGHGYFAGVAGRTYHLDGSAKTGASGKVFDQYNLRTFGDRLDFVKTAGQRDVILKQFREFLDAVPKGKPFVLQLCFSDPHRPLDNVGLKETHDPKKVALPSFFPDTQLVREDFARYLDEVSRFDLDVGTIIAELQQRGLLNDTLIVVAGDNGGALFRGKGTLYDLGLRVPFIAHWPNHIPAQRDSSAILSGEDLAPTILQASGVPVPKEMTGKSFLPVLTGKEMTPRKYVFAQRGAHGSGLPGNSAAFDLSRCVISQNYKLIYNVLGHLPYHPVDFAGDPMWKEVKSLHDTGKLAAPLSKLYFTTPRPMFELYNLKDDPDELRNLYNVAEFAAVQREHLEALHEWMILQRDFVPLPIPPDAGKKKKKKEAD